MTYSEALDKASKLNEAAKEITFVKRRERGGTRLLILLPVYDVKAEELEYKVYAKMVTVGAKSRPKFRLQKGREDWTIEDWTKWAERNDYVKEVE